MPASRVTTGCPFGLRLVFVLALVVASLVVVAPTAALAQSVQRIAAVVNDDVVTGNELLERIDLAIIFSGLEDSGDTRRRLAPQVLRRVIDERLQLQEAERLGVSVAEAEIDDAVSRIAQPNGMSVQQLYGYLRRRGVEPDTLRRQVRAEIAWAKLVRRELGPRVVVTDEQVDIELAAQQAATEEELLLSEIVLPVYAPEEEDEALAEAEELIRAVEEGAEFSALASQVSTAGSAEEGGDLGWVRLSSLPAALRPAVAGLEPGGISEPVRSSAGIHIFHVRDRRTASSAGGSGESIRLSQVFFPLSENAGGDAVEQTLDEARALRPQIATCGDLQAQADRLDAPSSGDLGWLRLDELPAALADIVAGLPPETVSEPVRSRAGVHLLMVCDTEDGSQGEAQREDVRNRLEQEQVQRLANRYLRDLRKDAFIDVRVEF